MVCFSLSFRWGGHWANYVCKTRSTIKSYVCVCLSLCSVSHLCMYLCNMLPSGIDFLLGSCSCCRCSWGACSSADILAYCMQLLHLWTGHNIDRTDLGTLIGNHSVLAETLDTHIANKHSSAHGEHTHQRLHIHLDNCPRSGASNAHQRYKNDGLHPVLNGKALVPLESGKEKRQ